MQAAMYELHHQLENSHWWFTARREIVLSLLRSELHGRASLRLLDVGCGAGGMVEHLREFGSAIGVDPSPAAIEFAASRPGLDVRRGGLPDSLPFDATERFDVITLLDVLEHVQDDAAALQSLHALLPADGRLVITVPAFQFLWSGHDVINQHWRRYTRGQLTERLHAAGFEIVRMSYYNTALFPPIAAVRLARRWLRLDDGSSGDLGRVPAPVNRVLHHLFAAERHLLRTTVLPFGVSLIAVARLARGAS